MNEVIAGHTFVKKAMPEKDWYKRWFSSPFYHKLYFERDDKEAKNFIKALLKFFKPSPGSLMLDIACGRGRHSKFLAADGFDVTGFDLSGESIQYAKQFENDHLHFYQHDMRLLFWINYFDYAFNFFTSFGYFATRREHDSAVRSISASLKPAGIVMFDYLNVHYVESHLVPDEIKIIGTTNYEIHRWMDDNHFYKRIIISDPVLSKPIEHTEKLVKFSLGDFTNMLSFQKIQITEVFGNYHMDAYHLRNTPRMIIVAKK